MDAGQRFFASIGDHYRPQRELGAGGMATVYLAHDLKHDRAVALKVLRPEFAASLGAERFLAEIRVTARLQHPHIVPLFDSGEADGFLYYVMPYIEGESLRTRLERDKRLDVEAMLAIARPVAQALACAHDVGVVHRDIKPENILLSRGQPFVTDFGIARAVTVAGGERLTATGLAIGTPAYMSPEQALGDTTIDARSDVYSLGCVIYEMLVGEPPFSGPTVQALIARRLAGPPPHLTGVPSAVDEVVRRSLATAPQDRFATAVALADALVEAARKPATPEKSIVVLPFENLSPDPDNAFFADGLTEELIAALTNVRALRVISRTSAMHFKGTTKSLPEVTRELNVRYALEGSVRRAGNNLRITAQLIDAATDAHLWAERYTGTLDDVFEIQERVSEAIVEALRVRLTPAERRKLAGRPIEDLSAYDSYLRAMSAVNRATEGDLREALRQLDIARATVGDHALLHCGYSYAHLVSANMGLAIDQNLDLCEEWARKALALDPTSAKARALLGLAGCWYRGRRPSAESVGHLKRALEDDPNELHALLGLCVIYVYAGRLSQAEVLSTRYVERDPLDGWSNWLPWYMAWMAGDYERALEVVPRSPAVSETQAGFVTWNLAWLGRSEEAIACADKAAAIAPRHVHTKLNLMVKHGLQRDLQAARAEITPEFHEWCFREAMWSYHMATAFALAGGADDALWWLEHAVDLGFINYPLIAEHDPFLAPLRSDPRFQRLMERVKREWEEFEV